MPGEIPKRIPEGIPVNLSVGIPKEVSGKTPEASYRGISRVIP